MTYTEKELDQFLHGISLSLLSKKSAQHWRYDEETAKEIEWLEVLERKVRADKADRKTENCSEKPNNCEHITEDGVTCAKYPACDDCLDNPLNKVKGSERLVKGSEQTDLVKKSPSLVKDLVNAFCEDGTWLERQGVYTLTLTEAKQRAVDIIEAVSRRDTADTPRTEERQELEAYRKCIKSRSFWDGKHCDDCMFYDDCPFDPREDEDEPNSSEKPNNSERSSE